jgi:hypothetical protein
MIIQAVINDEDVEIEYDVEYNDFSITLDDDINIYHFSQLSQSQMRKLYNDLDNFFGDKK